MEILDKNPFTFLNSFDHSFVCSFVFVLQNFRLIERVRKKRRSLRAHSFNKTKVPNFFLFSFFFTHLNSAFL